MTVETTNSSRRDFLRTMLLAVPTVAVAPRSVWAAASRIEPVMDLRFITSHMEVRRRHEWTTIPPNPSRLRVANRDRYMRITVHHEGVDPVYMTSEGPVRRHLDGVLGGHLKRRFGDVGYHFLIDYAGRVWEGRSLAYWGAHVSGHNEQNVGIMLLGNFEKQRPSRAQLHSLEHLSHLIKHHYGIRRGRIYGHIDLGQTLCPGRYLYPSVRNLNQLA